MLSLFSGQLRNLSIDIFNGTTLHSAVKKKNIAILELLINYGASINFYDEDHKTPLNICLTHVWECDKIVEFLLKNGASANIPDKNNEMPLHIAARKKEANICKLLINYGALVNDVNKNLKTPLHVATEEGQNENCKLLIDFGSDIYFKTKSNKTVLHIAAENKHYELCKSYLENYFFDISMPDCNGNTPKDYVVSSGNEDLINLFSKASDPVCLHKAILNKNLMHCRRLLQNVDDAKSMCHKDYEKVRFFLRKGDVGCYKNDELHTCSHYFAEGLAFQKCQSFFEKADGSHDYADDLKWNPFHFASISGDCEIVKCLFPKLKDSFYKLSSSNQTCLHVAALNGQVGVTKLLVEGNSFNLEDEDIRKWTLIHCAAFSGNYEVFQYLLKKGSDLLKVTNDGDNCLHIASYCGHLRICELILFRYHLKLQRHKKRETDNWLNSTDYTGNTCLHNAVKKKHVKITKLLLEYHADVTVKGKDMKTALDIALIGESQDITKILEEKKDMIGESNFL